MGDKMNNLANKIATAACLVAFATQFFMVALAIASIFLSGCVTNPAQETPVKVEQKTDIDYQTGQTAEALQKAAPVIDCAFTRRNLRFAECGD